MIYTLTLKDTISNIFYHICEGIASVISWILNLFPDNPFSDFTAVPDEVAEILGYVNYILPIKQMIVVILSWLAALIVIAVYKLVTGFFRLIGG